MADDPIVFPDIVSAVRKHVFAALAVKTFAIVPDTRPSQFVVVTLTGGVSRDVVIDAAQVTVDCWVDRHSQNSPGAEALTLAQQVRAHINAMHGITVDGTQIYAVRELSGPAWVPDTLSGAARYRQSFQIGARGVVLV